MSELTDWIEEAATHFGRCFRLCGPAEAKEVVTTARARFVDGNPRVWWLSLRMPYTSVPSEDRDFLDVVPRGTSRVWFIAEDDDELQVYDLDVGDVDRIRSHCPPFEYYVTDHDFRWLIIETDHDEFVTCREEHD